MYKICALLRRQTLDFSSYVLPASALGVHTAVQLAGTVLQRETHGGLFDDLSLSSIKSFSKQGTNSELLLADTRQILILVEDVFSFSFRQKNIY